MDPLTLKWLIIGTQGVLFLTAVGITVYLLAALTASAAIPPGFVDEFTDLVNRRKFKESFDMVRADRSYLGRLLTEGMAKLQYGLPEAKTAYAKVADVVQHDYKSMINYLPALAGVATLIGLLNAQGGGKDVTSDTYTTLGTLLSVLMAGPCIFGQVFFSNRLVQIDLDVRLITDDMLTQMYHNSKKVVAPS